MDASLLLLRDFSDLTRPELIARLRHLKILQTQVEYTHDNFSPRQLRAFVLAVLMLLISYVLTDSILFSGVNCLITIIGVLHYSRLPMTWHTQLKDGISRLESLRSSPLRQMDEANAHYDWHYASYCLAAEIQLIYSALSQPARPFSA
ncbi:hypothetical protein ISN41_22080 [Enterobacter bugandensis]|uniref:hypothetical protein n=1 Tax=Enterobacter bugandensis TaxID=881260 RepID=UPI001887E737|nr:hypothetical protein [Enterobacter bugandensis]MBF2750768.1 hypothetical protein [Enterobacter bugandensis]MBF2803609.1 hypothetical protein [Enterobacter bugandensis]